MQYYDKDGNLVDIFGKRMNKLGANGEIFIQENGTAYKKYFSFAEHRIKQAIFDFIRNMDTPHMVKLLDRYYLPQDISDIENFLWEANQENAYDFPYNRDLYKIDLYSYEWVKQEFLDLLEMPVDYLLDNVNELMKLADYFAKYRIMMADMRIDNLICNKEHIVLIDPDMYHYVSSSYDLRQLSLYNRKLILMTLKNLCMRLTSYKGEIVSNSIATLFSESIQFPKEALEHLTKKLSRYQMPIEYIAFRK